MSSGLGDVAFVNLKNIEKKTGRHLEYMIPWLVSKSLCTLQKRIKRNMVVVIGDLKSRSHNDNANSKGYRTLCLNEADVNEDRACLLTWTPLSAVTYNKHY